MAVDPGKAGIVIIFLPEGRKLPVEVDEISYKMKKLLPVRIFIKQMPVETCREIPLFVRSYFVAHEEQFFAGMGKLVA